MSGSLNLQTSPNSRSSMTPSFSSSWLMMILGQGGLAIGVGVRRTATSRDCVIRVGKRESGTLCRRGLELLIDEKDAVAEESQFRGRKIVREPRRSVIPAASAGERNIRWLVDTGCPIDLVGMNELNDSERYLISRSFPGHSLRTANGITGTHGRIDASAEHLPDRIEAHILPNTPALISVGKRCMEMGYSFRWDAGQLPELISSNGTVTTLEVINNVPYLPSGKCMLSVPEDEDEERMVAPQ